jgi:hypothetical protein
VHTRWSLQFSLARASGWAKTDRDEHDGIIAINAGWRSLPNGDLRVGTCVDGEGKTSFITIPAERLARQRKVIDLQSIRDKNFDLIKAEFGAWLKDNKPAAAPAWLDEKAKDLPLWRSTSRLAAVVIHWRTNRFEGDNGPHNAHGMYDRLEAWRKQDKHLLTWESHQRQGEIDWRLTHFRQVAADLSKRYRTCLLMDTDWTAFARTTKPEHDDGSFTLADFHRRCAGVSYLHACLTKRMVEPIEVESENLTKTCHVCGHVNEDIEPAHIDQQCRTCSSIWDMDVNAARNMLARHLPKASAAAS